MPAQDIKPDTLKNEPDLNEILLTWKSPSHPFKRRDRMFYQTIAAIVFLLVMIVFFMNDFMLIGVIIAIAFVAYAVTSVPPVEVEHKVTRLGLENAGQFFRWADLGAFWFERKWGYTSLVIQTRISFPAQIRAVVEKLSEEQVKKVMGKYLLFLEKPPKTVVDSFSEWLSNKIPLETN